MSPAHLGPTEKERKYDRQLRLWAATGQAALESANVLLINSGAGTVGTETLKNLVLPGIGRFTIFDEEVVDDADLGVNFFLDESCRGKPRAQCCAEFLLELNTEVLGDWHPKPTSPHSLRDFLETSSVFTVIIYALPLSRNYLHLLEAYGRKHQSPLIAIHSVGFYSFFRVQLSGIFPVVETHPDDDATADLRLLAPWPELSDFASDLTQNIESLSNYEHSHLPMVVILLYYLDVWKYQHGGANPISYSDKVAFRDLVAGGMRRNNPEGGEENFEEAVAAVMKHISLPSIPASVQKILDHPRTSQMQDNPSFWTIVEALQQFFLEHNRLPVCGRLPDMKAKSDVYITLQSIYMTKAKQDANEILKSVRNLPGGEQVDRAQVELFCTNVRFIKLINGDCESPNSLAHVVERQLENDVIAANAGPELPMSLLPIYLALTAVSDATVAAADDIMGLICEQAPALIGNTQAIKATQEVSRAAGTELHNVSAVTGGMVAQEVIKIITNQYIPIDNTCIYNGIESRCQILQL